MTTPRCKVTKNLQIMYIKNSTERITSIILNELTKTIKKLILNEKKQAISSFRTHKYLQNKSTRRYFVHCTDMCPSPGGIKSTYISHYTSTVRELCGNPTKISLTPKLIIRIIFKMWVAEVFGR